MSNSTCPVKEDKKIIITLTGNRSFRPGNLAPYFSSHLARFKCNIPLSISQKAEQARFKSNTVNPLLSPPRGLFERGDLYILEKTMVSVLHKELENEEEKLKYKKF